MDEKPDEKILLSSLLVSPPAPRDYEPSAEMVLRYELEESFRREIAELEAKLSSKEGGGAEK